jgi:hypothetical protein
MKRFVAAGIKVGHRFEAKRKAYLSPRTVAFNVHGVRLAIHRMTGPSRLVVLGCQYADAANSPRLLREAGDRPQYPRATDQRNEIAPPHSITSSATAINVVGMVMPSAFAVFKSITSSNLVGRWTGRSPGFSRLRMRST